MSHHAPLVAHLLDTGGPVVRWLTVRDLLEDPDPDLVARCREDLLAAPHVRLWLDRIAGVTRYHDSGNQCFENVAGKLGEFGLLAGMGDLDERLAPFREWIASSERDEDRGMMAELNRVLCVAGLLRLGYEDDALREHALRRLDTIHRVAASGRTDLFLAEDPPDLPKAYRGRYRVVDSWFTPDGACAVPYVHDLHLLAVLPEAWRTPAVAKRVDAVVRYVLSEGYQALPDGFGYVQDDSFSPPRYYVLGWKAHLPWFREPPGRFGEEAFVQMVEVLSVFPGARKHRWFREALDRLDEHRTDAGTWLLPRAWLREKPVAYWVGGGHMGLEENRRAKASIERESTLRVLRILK
jgi:hypothetical protein